MIKRINKRNIAAGFIATLLVSQGALAADDQAVKAAYEAKCAMCHLSGVANAPKLDNKEVWEAKAALGMETVLETVKKGLNAMPPMGGCADCSDEDLTNMIQYMIDAGTQ